MNIIIGGAFGPAYDAYNPERQMTAEEAEEYHTPQAKAFSESAGIDIITANTFGYSNEAIGLCKALKKHGLPVVMSFTLETDGKLPTGQTLKDAIEHVEAATDNYPAIY